MSAAAAANLAGSISGVSVLYRPLAWGGERPAIGRREPGAVGGDAAAPGAGYLDKGGRRSRTFWRPTAARRGHRPCGQTWAAIARSTGCTPASAALGERLAAATKADPDGRARAIADFTLASWSRLLAALGQVDQLGSLLQEAQDRTATEPGLQQLVDAERSGCEAMRRNTDASFRCGMFALSSVPQGL